MSWRFLKSGLSAVLVVACLLGMIQVLAYLTWSLAEAGSNLEPNERHETSTGDVVCEETVGRHQVREWPDQPGLSFKESPELEKRVVAGELEPVGQRLPRQPLVIDPPQQMGPYGGTWTRYATSARDVGSMFHGRLTYDGLVRWSPLGEELLPNLARDWEVKDDGHVFVIHLREGVRWSDGIRFDADDVMFWYDHVLLNENLTRSIHRDWQPGGEVFELSKLGQYTLRFEFHETHALFMERTLGAILPDTMLVPSHYMKRYHKDFIQPEGDGSSQEGELPDWYQRKMDERGYTNWSQLYNYMNRWQNPDRPTLRAWKMSHPPPSRPVVLTRNPYYWKVDPEGRQLPYIDRVSFEIYDRQIITMRAIEGRMDMQKRHVRFEDYPLLMQNRDEGGYQVRQWRAGSGNELLVGPNLNHHDPAKRELLDDRRFRQALSLAIDRQMINQARYFGQAQPRQVAASSRSPFYDPEYESAHIDYDPLRAIKLLEQIGLERDKRSGRWLGRDGRPLRFHMDVTQTPSGGDAIVDLIAEAWTAIGLRTDVNRLARSLWTQRRNAAVFDFIVWEGEMEEMPLLEPRWYFPSFMNSYHAPEYARWFSSGGAEGTEPDGDIRQAMEIYWDIEKELAPQRRIEKFMKISRLSRENLWVIGTLGHAPVPVVVHNEMKNVPDVALSSYTMRSPANTAPEAYVLDREAD